MAEPCSSSPSVSLWFREFKDFQLRLLFAMESSANLQSDHQIQELFLGYSSLASAQRRTANSTAYHPAFSLDGNNPHMMNPNESFQISRNLSQPVVDLRTQDFNNIYGRRNGGQQSTLELELLLPRAKKSEFSESSYNHPSDADELNSSSSKYLQKLCQDDMSYQNPWFNFSTGLQHSGRDQLPGSTAHYNDPYRFSEINTSLYSTSEMGLELDHLSSGIYQSLREKVDIRDESMPWLSHSLMQQYSSCLDSPSNSSNKVSTVTRTKKAVAGCSSGSSSKESYSSDVRKSISRSKPARPPLKVRKEKLGDRVSALQRLVAPFGKTDTASVLSEVIGYIQFLHDQVQTLSVPYMESKSKSKSSQGKGKKKQEATPAAEGKKQRKEELGKRGLCLVPISCASFIN